MVSQDSIVTTTDYLSGFQYVTSTGSVTKLEFFPTAEGYVEPTETGGYQYVYNYTDHLGNIRLSYSDTDEDGTIDALTEIREENNYYPFGLKHKGYNDETINSKYKYKYNGQELQDELGYNMYAMDMRQYDPAIARWVVQDPIIHHNISTYSAFDNNPVFWADPSGADGEHYNWDKKRYEDDQGNEVSFETAMASVGLNADGTKQDGKDDNITVNSDGIVTHVEPNDKPNRYFDSEGKELFFNDPNGVDIYNNTDSYSEGDRLFYALTVNEFMGHIFDTGIVPNGLPIFARYAMAALKSHNEWDFAENYLADFIDKDLLAKDVQTDRRNGSTTYESISGYFRFGNTNYIYNLYDAGNYMWGAAMSLSFFSYPEVKAGSHMNSTITTGSIDTEADQNAIKNGYYGK